MIITMIGSGNVATVLGNLFKSKGHVVNEVAGRNKTIVEELAKILDANACIDYSRLNQSSDIYIIAVRDDAVAEVSAQLNVKDKTLLHTCGSIPGNALENASSRYGVLYPLQSLRKETGYLPSIPFLIDANNEITKKMVYNLACSVSDNVVFANDEQRLHYHLSAIVVSNFSNHLFALAKDYCDANDISFKALLPLIEETVNRLHLYEPSSMQTGPAIRGDKATMQKHLALLKGYPELKNIYETISESIMRQAKRK